MFGILIFEKEFNNLKVPLEQVSKGREGGVLVKDVENIPLVRTTTKYKKPAMKMNKDHIELMKMAKITANNALIELYTDEYKTMGYHSDQDLDLKPGSEIAIYSKYSDKVANRKLVIKNKKTEKVREVLLEHNSVLKFNYTTNSEYLHKIVLVKPNKNTWLGITFRESKTFIKFVNEKPFFQNGKELRLANKEEHKEFYELRSKENKSNKDVYMLKKIYYTISPSDLLVPNNLLHSN